MAGTRFPSILIVDEPDLRSGKGNGQSACYIGNRDAMLRGFYLIDAHNKSGLRDPRRTSRYRPPRRVF